MPEVRLLAPWSNSKGEPQAAGAVINVSDDEANELGNRGMISRLDEEKKLEQQGETNAVYNASLTRQGTAEGKAQGEAQPQTQRPQQPPQPQQPARPQQEDQTRRR